MFKLVLLILQETRVCERVDEVDCSKSEKFYSLNLELYGNTAPPIIKDSPKLNDGNVNVVLKTIFLNCNYI